MNRREIIRYTALVSGAALSAPLLSSLLVGCRLDPVADASSRSLQFFNEEEFQLISELADILLPKSDSPSATEVGVHYMIDHMLGAVYTSENQEIYKAGFLALGQYLKETRFSKMNAEEKVALLKSLDGSSEENLKTPRKAFWDFKQQTIAYYLATEEIGTQFLNYLPVPGTYESCISLEEAGNKAWTL